MTTILICWLVGMVLPYIWAGASVPFRTQQLGSVDLVSPRLQGEKLVDRGAWAVGAQGNAWEALIIFSAANVMAISQGVEPGGIWSTLAMVWAAARVAHGVFYMAGIAPLRVLSFLAGLICSIWIVVLALTA